MLSIEDFKTHHYDAAMDTTQFLTTRNSPDQIEGANTVSYMGYAAPGTLESDPAWIVKKFIDYPDGSAATLFANHGQPDQVWTNRESLSYS